MADAQQKTILLVEDEAPVIMVLKKALEREGYNVITASDGFEGLRLALEKHPDLIITDLLMARMGGMDMIREIRKDEWGKGAEIIILTNVTDVKMLDEAMRQQTFHYIVKGDSSMESVVQKVNERLKNAPAST